MSSCIRLSVIALLGGGAVLAATPPAQAQRLMGGVRGPMFSPTIPMVSPLGGFGFSPLGAYGFSPMAAYGGFNTRGFQPIPSSMFGGLRPVRGVTPLPGINGFNPLMFNPMNPSYNASYSSAATYYYLNRYGQAGYSSYAMPSTGYSSYPGGYMTGGVRSPAYDSASLNFSRAQQAAAVEPSLTGGRRAVDDQRTYEQRGAAGLPGSQLEENSTALAKALAGTDPTKLTSGESLNQILAAVIAAQGKGGKAESAHLPPNLLAEVRFAGGPNATAVNLLRTAGKLEFPAAFDDGPLAALRPVLARDFAAAAAPVLAGKAADGAKVAALEATVKKVGETLNPLIRGMDFEAAIAARRFLNQLDDTVTALKTPAAAGLIDPSWAAEGTSVADLVRRMAKNKLQFGPAAKGAEEVYAALHHGLAAYLLALGQNVQPKK
ncbi:MAG: hypothetical protein JWO38_7818 [Gemmataceae bacterium]|nr:hypothetical protein [Gemmataceae bacterium]